MSRSASEGAQGRRFESGEVERADVLRDGADGGVIEGSLTLIEGFKPSMAW